MQWLAEICVKRPVFASVLILSLTVVGAVRLRAAGRRPLSQGRLPHDLGDHAAAGRGARADRDRGHRQDRGSRQHHQRHRHAALHRRPRASRRSSSRFTLEKDVDVAAQEVRDRVNRVLPELPRTVAQPTVEKLDPDASPVMTRGGDGRQAASATSPSSPTRCCGAGSRARDGVGQVRRARRPQPPDQRVARPGALRAQRLYGQRRGARAAGAERRCPRRPRRPGAPAVTLRTRGRVDTIDGVRRHRRCARSRGHPVRLRDVGARRGRHGRAAHAGQRQRRAHRAAADPQAVGHQHRRGRQQRQGAARRTRRPSLPAGYELRIVRDQSEFIEASIESVQEHLVVGSILAALVVLLFLRQRALDGHCRASPFRPRSSPPSRWSGTWASRSTC